MTTDPLVPPFTDKVAVAVRHDLATWQRLNVTAFLISAVTAAHPELVGADYQDADGQRYLRMLGIPVLVFEASGQTLAAARSRAVGREFPLAVYTRDMFATGHDADNRAAVHAVAGADLELVGIGLHGARNAVDKILKGAHLHR
ncbi:DUF2000 domain-containing protein [Nakamurella flavida]|uniref:DUF2000 domain-containing protein n=1 Tax=Nakamurella flavida TaxID=363630 RepID=A0A939C1Q2_9ACTN|nr:DUF2000 domain-containing protein [Nakamurella flavida]MBM9477928.1 DUF2000 domain-containing protein [Nakamurella flavida]MDP9778357.1 hypothetical protein [Nakamurella flavida]